MTQVVCALIIHYGKVLVMQYGNKPGYAFRWEFPGGKINPSESEKEALNREIMEELEIMVDPFFKLEEVVFSHKGKTIRLMPYLCHTSNTNIVLNEHSGFTWIDPEEIPDLDLLEADRLILKNQKNYVQLLQRCRENMEKSAHGRTPGYNG